MSRAKIFILLVVVLTLVGIAVVASSDLVDEHEQKCRENVKIIVHDELLWQQFRSQAQAAYQKEAAQIPPMTGRTYYVGVGEFTVSFGKNRTYFRPSAKNEIVRNDLFIMKGDKTVAQIVDFTYQYGGSLDGPTSFNCLHLYKGMSDSHS
tara:strand:+ start:767 stop:1216 length:450 start_codon:yes stop_codon:yes gene_type:complete